MDDFDKRFEARRKSFDRQFKWMNWAIASVFVLVVIGMLATAYAAYEAGCIKSMLLNHICLSDPKIDGILKTLFGK